MFGTRTCMSWKMWCVVDWGATVCIVLSLRYGCSIDWMAKCLKRNFNFQLSS